MPDVTAIGIAIAVIGTASSFVFTLININRMARRDALEDERVRSDYQAIEIKELRKDVESCKQRERQLQASETRWQEKERQWEEDKLRLYERIFALEKAVRNGGGKL